MVSASYFVAEEISCRNVPLAHAQRLVNYSSHIPQAQFKLLLKAVLGWLGYLLCKLFKERSSVSYGLLTHSELSPLILNVPRVRHS